MKFRFPLSLPSRADGTRLPALLAGLLAVALVVQWLTVGSEAELPPAMAVGAAHSNFATPTVTRVVASPVIFTRPLFAPRKSALASPDEGPSSFLGGAVVAGTMSIRGRSYAVVRRPTGSVINLPIGGSVQGWRLIALGLQSAQFMKGNDRQMISYGTQPPSGSTPEPADQ